MKILKITPAENTPIIQNETKNKKQNTYYISNSVNFGYQDFNINFRGRTPENFYEQEFNIKFMPETMKKYLYANYEERKHIPPEQIMSESFKYLKITDNFADVKSTYPDEILFKNLHEANLKGRSGILSDIKLAKEMSDTPLFNDGEDNFGIYLLRKIYLEGKTIKEINKDFYEKDLAPDYKGIVTQPITYGTTSAFGIQYPKTDFWNSFIATRDEYKKFFVNLPKQNKTELKKELEKLKYSKISESESEKPKPRKYSVKKYQKEQMKRDIIKTKGNEEAIKRAITKHFKQDDPEAAFIVKYLSPIMTVAADRVHLSEEMRYFAENTKADGKKIENLFAQFWKAHPEILEHYSTAITDTIELFEETYESGGVLPINNDYQLITQSTKNQKPIDFVPQRFVELLNYIQTIGPNRQKLYALHDEEQAKWNEHFLWRYGEIKPVVEEKAQEIPKNPLEMLKETAGANNAGVYTLKGVNGEEIHITANLDEALGDYIKHEYTGFPSKFVNLIIKRALKEPLMTEKAKLSFAATELADRIDEKEFLTKAEKDDIMKSVMSGLRTELATASMATLDTLAAHSKEPQKIYRTISPNHLSNDLSEYSVTMLKVGSNAEYDKKANELYDLYRKPLSEGEKIKIVQILSNYIRNFDAEFASSEKSVFYNNPELIQGLEEIKEKFNINVWGFGKQFRQLFQSKMLGHISNYSFGRSLLIKNISANQLKAKTEAYMSVILNSMLLSAVK